MRTENIYSVYVHKNLKNGKYYVGATKQNPKKRWHNGWGYKGNQKMWKDIRESDWNKDWVHGILGKFDNKNEALRYESFLIFMLDSVRNGYNSSEYSSYGFTEETLRKMSESRTGKKNPMFGMTGEKNPFYGKHLSEGHKNKISESMTGNHNKPQKAVLQFSRDGEFIAEYSSLMEAERKTSLPASNICACCKGKLKSTGGYIWKYKEGV